MNYSHKFVLRHDSDLLARLVVATERAAAAIIGEDPATPDHATRWTWAVKAILDPTKTQCYASAILRYAVAADALGKQDGAALTDDQLQAIVAGAVPTLVASGL